MSFATGIFISITPTFGIHTILALLIAFMFRLNKVSLLIGTLLNNPWTTFFVYLLSYKIGALLLSQRLDIVNNFTIDFLLHKGLKIYLITWLGSLILAMPLSVFFYFLLKYILEKKRKIKTK